DLYRDGRSIKEIAKERGLSPTTIENHLIRFISTGEISLEQFVSLDKVETIQQAIIKFQPSDALSPVKEFLGDDYSYAEIRAVKATL
ncbi:MAG: helix-turn-helix domain-containing protein, partial [Pyrinomonadaceae bacterium]